MPVSPKKHLLELDRVVNESLERSSFFRMDKNENLEGFSDEVIFKIREIITSDFLTAYPEVNPLYSKLADHLRTDKKNIFLTSGSDAGIKATFEVFVEPGDEVIIIHPTYAMYYVYSKMFKARLLKVCFDEKVTLSPNQLIDKISPSTKLICIANPNSPTGTIIPNKDLENIIAVASKNNSLVLIDEAYYQFLGNSMACLINDYNNLIISRTFSKAFGLASARLGYIVSNFDIISHLHRVRPMYEVNSFAVALGLYLLNNPNLVESHVKEIGRSRKWIERELSKSGFRTLPGHANFILINVGGKERAQKIAEDLYKEKIVIKGGFNDPCLQSYIRVGLGSLKQMEYFLKIFRKVLV